MNHPTPAPPPGTATTLVVGCGNLIRGDDAAGPILVRRLADHDLGPAVRLADAGTAGMDVAFAMRGASRVIVVDASATGAEPGTIHRIPGEELEDLKPPGGNLHQFRWDQALSFARWLLKDEYPAEVEVLLIEGESFAPGEPLSPKVSASVNWIAEMLVAEFEAERDKPLADFARPAGKSRPATGTHPDSQAQTDIEAASDDETRPESKAWM